MRIDADLAGAREILQREPAQRVRPPHGQQQSQQPAERGEDEALGEKLPHEAAPAAAERGPDRDLAVARRGARQQQVGHVRAADQQDEADRAEQHHQRGPDLPTTRSASGMASACQPIAGG